MCVLYCCILCACVLLGGGGQFFIYKTYYTSQREIWRDISRAELMSVISALFLEAHPLVHFRIDK